MFRSLFFLKKENDRHCFVPFIIDFRQRESPLAYASFSCEVLSCEAGRQEETGNIYIQIMILL